jgi:hypothetical protein
MNYLFRLLVLFLVTAREEHSHFCARVSLDFISPLLVNRLLAWSGAAGWLKLSLIGVGSAAHVLNNCMQHGTDTLQIDIESIVLKVYNYFSIYTVKSGGTR